MKANPQSLYDQFSGCILGGAIGDAYGGQYENKPQIEASETLFIWGNVEAEREYFLSDDTQLTLATCQAFLEVGKVDPEVIAHAFLAEYEKGKFSGLGAATLQAIEGLRRGGHWWLVGRKGEQAAGNGAAMRIAPLAFLQKELDREVIRNICRITHQNDEAYTGALAVVIGIRLLLKNGTLGGKKWLSQIADELPDTLVKDRIRILIPLLKTASIKEIAQSYGNGGYVVESVPFALFATAKSWNQGFESSVQEIISSGGDTDTNASIMGQIAGAKMGKEALPIDMLKQISLLPGYSEVEIVLKAFEEKLG